MAARYSSIPKAKVTFDKQGMPHLPAVIIASLKGTVSAEYVSYIVAGATMILFFETVSELDRLGRDVARQGGAPNQRATYGFDFNADRLDLERLWSYCNELMRGVVLKIIKSWGKSSEDAYSHERLMVLVQRLDQTNLLDRTAGELIDKKIFALRDALYGRGIPAGHIAQHAASQLHPNSALVGGSKIPVGANLAKVQAKPVPWTTALDAIPTWLHFRLHFVEQQYAPKINVDPSPDLFEVDRLLEFLLGVRALEQAMLLIQENTPVRFYEPNRLSRIVDTCHTHPWLLNFQYKAPTCTDSVVVGDGFNQVSKCSAGGYSLGTLTTSHLYPSSTGPRRVPSSRTSYSSPRSPARVEEITTVYYDYT